MGLFNIGAKKEAAEQAVYQSLKRLDLVDLIVAYVVEHEESWPTSCQSYYDNLRRKIVVNPDRFGLSWTEDKSESVRFTSAGYRPLHSHYNEKDYEDVSLKRVLYLWATVIKEALQEALPNCIFEEVFEDTETAGFYYTVPARQWKDWF